MTKHESSTRKIALVYQAGIANVFDVTDASNPKRLLQNDFHSCEWFARGLGAAGCIVRSRHCNKAGDITGDFPWEIDLEDAPFRNSMSPVSINVVQS